MKITIITATRNRASVLGKTIESVLNQTHNDIDYIIIDGASTDNSVEVIQQWQKRAPGRIRYISQTDSGVYEAINRGITLANGDIIGTLHAGDTFSSQHVLSQINCEMSDGKSVDMVYGDVHYINPNTGKIVRKYSAKDFSVDMLKNGIAPPHPSLYMRKELFTRYGLYKEDYLIGADFEMFIRLMLINGLSGKYLPIDMVEMTTGGLSTRLYHQLITNNREKYRALRENSIKVCWFSLLKRYLYILKNSHND